MPWADALECALISPAWMMDVGTVDLPEPRDPAHLAGTGSACSNVPFLSSLAVDGEYLGAFNRFAVRVLPGRLPVMMATKSPRFGK